MVALELVGFCAGCFAVAIAGGVVGLVVGNIRLLIVLLVASSPAAGAGVIFVAARGDLRPSAGLAPQG